MKFEHLICPADKFYKMAAACYTKITKVDADTYKFLKDFVVGKIRKIAEFNDIDVTTVNLKDDLVNLLENQPYLLIPDIPDQSAGGKKPVVLKNVQKLTDSDDIHNWLDAFQMQAEHQEIRQKEWAILIAPLLSGTASQAWGFLTIDERSDWKVVRETILKAYRLSPDYYRNKFNNTKKTYKGTYTEFGNKLMQNLRRWLEPSDVLMKNAEYIQHLEKHALNQMLETERDEAIYDKLQELEGKPLSKICELVDDFARHHQSWRSGDYYGRESGRKGSKKNDRKDDNPCDSGSGAKKDVDKEKDGKSSGTYGECWNCGNYGHRSFECKKPKKDRKPDEKPAKTEKVGACLRLIR